MPSGCIYWLYKSVQKIFWAWSRRRQLLLPCFFRGTLLFLHKHTFSNLGYFKHTYVMMLWGPVRCFIDPIKKHTLAWLIAMNLPQWLPKVKSNNRSKFSNLRNWKEEAWKYQGFNGMPLKLWYFRKIYCDDHSSLSSITAVQIYEFHMYFTIHGFHMYLTVRIPFVDWPNQWFSYLFQSFAYQSHQHCIFWAKRRQKSYTLVCFRRNYGSKSFRQVISHWMFLPCLPEIVYQWTLSHNQWRLCTQP